MRCRFVFAAAAFLTLVGLVSVAIHRRSDEDRSPLVLARIQSLGELRTARFTFQHVGAHETTLEPADWARAIPGATALVESATRNEALMSAVASVDAGVNLREARLLRGENGWRVRLPEPELYEPVVNAKVHSTRRGLFWRDDNVVISGLADLKTQARLAARQSGITSEAKRNAEDRIRQFLGDPEVQFEWALG